MGKMRAIVLACAALAGQTTAAAAADLMYPPDKGIVEVPAPVPVAYGGWYLRGFMGMTNQDVDKITSSVIEAGDFRILNKGFDSSPLWGLGVGYDTGHYFRFDMTGEYRGAASFTALDCYSCDAGVPTAGTNEYTATKSEWLMLFNAYWDIGTWKGVTPYLGAGIGWDSIKIDDFKDINVPNAGVAFANSKTTTNFAWALHAGFAYDVTQNFALDFAYRYVNLGDAKSGVITAYDGTGTFDRLEFKDIDSHDLMIGARWKFGCDCGAVPAVYK